MLAVFYGSQTEDVRMQAHAYMKAEIEKGKTLLSFPEEYIPGLLQELSEATSLFGDARVVLIDTPSQHPELFNELKDLLPLLSKSQHTFVVIEMKIPAGDKKIFAKHAETLSEFTKDREESFSTFALADSLLRKDKKSFWTLLQKSKEVSSFEEIVGILLWQLKTIRLAQRTHSAEEAGLKPFVFNKAKSANFTNEEVDHLTRELLRVYHDAHLGKRDGELALEKFVLSS